MPPFERLARSASFRLAAAQTALFLCVIVVVGMASMTMVRRAELSAAHAELEEFEDDITDPLISQGLDAVIAKMARRHDVSRDFRLEDPKGRVLAGTLPRAPPPSPGAAKGPHAKYWTIYRVPRAPPYPEGKVLAEIRHEENGLVLTVGEYLAIRERKDDALLFAVLGFGVLATASGLVIGLMVSRGTQRRIDQISGAVSRYADGERQVRIPTRPTPEADHDELAQAINTMMERENRLIESLRQTTTAVAHDLRRPLAHHNQEIARALDGPPDVAAYRAALTAAAERAEDVLQTFQSLLHIAELEAGAPGLPLEAVNVGAVAARVVEAYRPAAEEGARRLSLEHSGQDLTIQGDARVLGRALANLVENALSHTPPGAAITVKVDGARRRLMVEDDGPGVPDADRKRIFERFVRLDASRSTPGNGLGLPLAAAAVQAFGGKLTAEDARPGLRLVADFA